MVYIYKKYIGGINIYPERTYYDVKIRERLFHLSLLIIPYVIFGWAMYAQTVNPKDYYNYIRILYIFAPIFLTFLTIYFCIDTYTKLTVDKSSFKFYSIIGKKIIETNMIVFLTYYDGHFTFYSFD